MKKRGKVAKLQRVVGKVVRFVPDNAVQLSKEPNIWLDGDTLYLVRLEQRIYKFSGPLGLDPRA